jgi:transposase-like protein
MSLSDTDTAPNQIPVITCPSCGEHMRLSSIVPGDRRGDRMKYVCDCGFDYVLSMAAAEERRL